MIYKYIHYLAYINFYFIWFSGHSLRYFFSPSDIWWTSFILNEFKDTEDNGMKEIKLVLGGAGVPEVVQVDADEN